jgi:1-deoxy-D-xylulose 5-phosphate reductoisomerase
VVPTWLSAANEIAVDAFLHGRIPWVSICAVIEEVLASAPNLIPSTVSDVLEADANARLLATQVVTRWETR